MSNNYNEPKREWDNQNWKIVSFTYPMKVEHSHYKRKEYMIVLFYQTQHGLHQKKIFFGFKGKTNKLIEKNFRGRRRPQENPFHPAFWENKLLNNKETLLESFAATVKEVLDEKHIVKIEKPKTEEPKQ